MINHFTNIIYQGDYTIWTLNFYHFYKLTWQQVNDFISLAAWPILLPLCGWFGANMIKSCYDCHIQLHAEFLLWFLWRLLCIFLASVFWPFLVIYYFMWILYCLTHVFQTSIVWDWKAYAYVLRYEGHLICFFSHHVWYYSAYPLQFSSTVLYSCQYDATLCL